MKTGKSTNQVMCAYLDDASEAAIMDGFIAKFRKGNSTKCERNATVMAAFPQP
jgi:hypothetical protein